MSTIEEVKAGLVTANEEAKAAIAQPVRSATGPGRRRCLPKPPPGPLGTT
jgi:hypothetical protein